MKRASSLIVLVAVFGLLTLNCENAPAPTEASYSDHGGTHGLAKATVIRDNFTIPIIDELALNPCNGEDILFNGAIHVQVHTVFDGRGGFHSQFTANDRNVSGVGQTTGALYRRVGATTNSNNINGTLPINETFTNTFSYIGQGPGNNFVIQEVFHVSINANGVITVFFDRFRVECR